MSPAAPLRAPGRVRQPAAADLRRPAPRLRVITAPPSTRRRVPFAASCAALLALTLVALLLLNIALSRGAYQVHELEERQALLAEQQQALSERLAAEAAPGRLAQRAAALGMVPNESPALLRLADGAVLGSPEPATAPPPPPAPAAPTQSEGETGSGEPAEAVAPAADGAAEQAPGGEEPTE